MTSCHSGTKKFFYFHTGLSVSKQTDSYTDTFPSLTAPSGEECDTGLQAAKGYTLMNLLSWQQIGQRRNEDFCVKHLTIMCLDLAFFRCDINKSLFGKFSKILYPRLLNTDTLHWLDHHQPNVPVLLNYQIFHTVHLHKH